MCCPLRVALSLLFTNYHCGTSSQWEANYLKFHLYLLCTSVVGVAARRVSQYPWNRQGYDHRGRFQRIEKSLSSAGIYLVYTSGKRRRLHLAPPTILNSRPRRLLCASRPIHSSVVHFLQPVRSVWRSSPRSRVHPKITEIAGKSVFTPLTVPSSIVDSQVFQVHRSLYRERFYVRIGVLPIRWLDFQLLFSPSLELNADCTRHRVPRYPVRRIARERSFHRFIYEEERIGVARLNKLPLRSFARSGRGRARETTSIRSIGNLQSNYRYTHVRNIG